MLPGGSDPFLQFDHFHLSGPTFAAHPHAGFCAVTYLLPDSPGSLRNRDSLGSKRLILPGDLHWTIAGRGVLHEELPTADGVDCHGLQIFVNLPADQKLREPSALHLSAHDVPRVRLKKSGVVRVLCGTHRDAVSPLTPPTPVTLLDVTMAAGEVLNHALADDQHAFAYVVAGSVSSGGREADAGSLIGFSDTPGALLLSASSSAQVLICHGRPLCEPMVAHGPFVMSNREQLLQAFGDHAAGRMGRL